MFVPTCIAIVEHGVSIAVIDVVGMVRVNESPGSMIVGQVGTNGCGSVGDVTVVVVVAASLAAAVAVAVAVLFADWVSFVEPARVTLPGVMVKPIVEMEYRVFAPFYVGFDVASRRPFACSFVCFEITSDCIGDGMLAFVLV